MLPSVNAASAGLPARCAHAAARWYSSTASSQRPPQYASPPRLFSTLELVLGIAELLVDLERTP